MRSHDSNGEAATSISPPNAINGIWWWFFPIHNRVTCVVGNVLDEHMSTVFNMVLMLCI